MHLCTIHKRTSEKSRIELKSKHVVSKNTHLSFGKNFNHEIELTPFVTHLSLGNSFNRKIILTKYILCLESGNKFDKFIKLNKYIQIVIFGIKFNSVLVLPKNLKNLILGYSYNKSIKLTSQISKLVLDGYIKPLELAKNIKYFICNSRYIKIILPKHITHLELKRYRLCLSFSKLLSHVHLGYYGTQNYIIEFPMHKLHVVTDGFIPDNLPNGIKNVEIINVWGTTKYILNNMPSDTKITLDICDW